MKFEKSFRNSIAGASVLLTLLGFVGKGVGFIREIVYAQKFGLSYEFDLFLLSIALPNLIITATIYISQHYFIPVYNQIKEKSWEEAESFFNNTFWQFLLGSIFLSIVLYFTSDVLFNLYQSALPPSAKELSISIYELFLLTIPFNAGMSIIMAYQQANFNFTTPAISLIFLNLLVIIVIVIFFNLFAIYVLPVSFVLAYFVSFIYLIFHVKKSISFTLHFKVDSKYQNRTATIVSLIVIEVSSLSYVLIDRYFAGELNPGGISALNYAFVIFALPISLFSLPLVTTIFSKFSNSLQYLPKDFRIAYKMNLFLMVPFIFLFNYWGIYFLEIFYQRGQFTSADTLLTFDVLRYYSFGLIFLTSYYLIVKALYSLRDYKSVLVISVIVFSFKIIFNFIFVDSYKQNGLAISTTLVYFTLYLSGLLVLFYKSGITSYKVLIMDCVYFLINATLSYLIILVIKNIFNGLDSIASILGLLVFVLIYIFNSYILNDEEFSLIKNIFVKILRT